MPIGALTSQSSPGYGSTFEAQIAQAEKQRTEEAQLEAKLKAQIEAAVADYQKNPGNWKAEDVQKLYTYAQGAGVEFEVGEGWLKNLGIGAYEALDQATFDVFLPDITAVTPGQMSSQRIGGLIGNVSSFLWPAGLVGGLGKAALAAGKFGRTVALAKKAKTAATATTKLGTVGKIAKAPYAGPRWLGEKIGTKMWGTPQATTEAATKVAANTDAAARTAQVAARLAQQRAAQEAARRAALEETLAAARNITAPHAPRSLNPGWLAKYTRP